MWKERIKEGRKKAALAQINRVIEDSALELRKNA